MKKSLSIICLLAAVMLALTACDSGDISGFMKITSADGAGVMTYSVEIAKDGAPNDDGTGVVEEQALYMVNGIEGIANSVRNCVSGDGVEVAVTEDTDNYWVVSVTIPFNNIDDYNAKMANLIPGTPFKPATFTDNGDTVTFVEHVDNFWEMANALREYVNADGENYDPVKGDPANGPIKPDEMAKIKLVTLTMGGEEITLDPDGGVKEFNVTVDKASFGVASETAVETETATETNSDSSSDSGAKVNPPTGDDGVAVALTSASALFAGAALVILFTGRKKATGK